MKKKIIIGLTIAATMLVVGVLVVVVIKYNEHELINTINNSYSESVKTTKKVYLYKKEKNNYNKIGTVDKNQTIKLEKIKKISKETTFFKLKDASYFIYYKNIKPTKESIEEEYKNRILFNENILIKKKTVLSNKIQLKESISLPILEKGEKYIVKFNDSYFSIEKENIIKEVEEKNTIEEEIDKVPAIYIKDTSEIEENIKKLTEQNYSYLTIEEYNKWKNKYIRIPNKSILIIVDDKEKIKETLNKYNVIVNENNESIKLNNSNKVSMQNDAKEEINNYILDISTFKDYDKMLNCETIKKESTQVEVTNIDSKYSTSIPVLNYHFFYDDTQGEECNERICLQTSKFEEQLKYLKDNNYKTLTIHEFNDWMDGKIEVPAKSVLLTIDDGAKGTSFINGNKLIPLLEKYDLNATLFLITAWWDINNYKSKNLDVQSHGYDIHITGACGTHKIKCLNHEELKADFQKSLDIIGDDTSFCFPFYVYTNDSINVLKELGFKLAFVGGNRNATRQSNKFLVPRYPIYKDITMEQFINKIK